MVVPLQNQEAVYDAIAQVKAEGGRCGTNFYCTPSKLEKWIAQKQLWIAHGASAVFLLRRECDLSRLYFCAANPEALESGLGALPEFRREKMVVDMIASGPKWLAAMERAGMRRYQRLLRLTRLSPTGPHAPGPWTEQVAFARESDAPAVLSLIGSAFNRYAQQIPSLQEIMAAAQVGRVLILKLGSEIAGLLYFENHGATSTLRFWTVAARFRDRHVGGALMKYYLASQARVRRFVLWVDEGNADAIQKYRHFYYDNDGIADDILANDCIPE